MPTVIILGEFMSASKKIKLLGHKLLDGISIELVDGRWYVKKDDIAFYHSDVFSDNQIGFSDQESAIIAVLNKNCIYSHFEEVKKQSFAFEKEMSNDPGAHYRYTYKGIKLDPFRIANIYGISDFARQTILKKVLRCGAGGHKDARQDLLDIISAAQRGIEMLDEDNLTEN